MRKEDTEQIKRHQAIPYSSYISRQSSPRLDCRRCRCFRIDWRSPSLDGLRDRTCIGLWMCSRKEHLPCLVVGDLLLYACLSYVNFHTEGVSIGYEPVQLSGDCEGEHDICKQRVSRRW